MATREAKMAPMKTAGIIAPNKAAYPEKLLPRTVAKTAINIPMMP